MECLIECLIDCLINLLVSEAEDASLTSTDHDPHLSAQLLGAFVHVLESVQQSHFGS